MDSIQEQDVIELTGVSCPELEEGSKLCCLFLGHSYISRLEHWLRSSKNPFGLNLALDCVLKCKFLSGITIPVLNRLINRSKSTISNVELILLDIGGNDLTEQECDEHVLFEMIFALVRNIRAINSYCTIVVFQLLHRRHLQKKVMCLKQRKLNGVCCNADSVSLYNSKVDSVNKLIKEKCSSLANVKYWCHKRLWNKNAFEKLFDLDGVHLSDAGMLKYAESVRGSIVYSAHRR